MKKRMVSFELLSLFITFSFIVFYAFSAYSQTVVAPSDFFLQVLREIGRLGGLAAMLKVSACITLVISSMKVSFFNELIWMKFGSGKVYAAPTLGLIAGIIYGPGTAPSVFAYLLAGGGSVFLHEILDSIKAVPMLGKAYLAFIEAAKAHLGGPKSS